MADTVSFGYRKISPVEKKRLVREQFDPLARTYDLADAVLSAGLDSLWRRRAIHLLGLRAGARVLDVCGGTAELALLALRKSGPGGCAVVYDFNRAMMEQGRSRGCKRQSGGCLLFVQGDAEELSFAGNAFDAVTVGFGLRNLANPEQGLAEMYRVLRPGGALMILEFSLPVDSMLRHLYHFYSFKIMPRIARLICGTAEPFRYLAESIRVFPSPEEIAGLMIQSGFSKIRFMRFANGLAVTYFGCKPPLTEWEEEKE
ncbi:MAG: class I SAM-dependent methyltransferase [Syntrophobacteraceae bacterium]|jgi:demethylmenaquinone methyltransferase/2-methoxy-6-polyprenyl-1,4-benzoquinol methylase